MAVKASSSYFDLLNQAVARELQVSVQYMLQHAKMEKLMRKVTPENILLDKTTYDAVGKFLKDFAIAEMKHAADITERIYYLGGSATTKADKVTVGNSLSEFAKAGIRAEEEALVLYRTIIKAAEQLGDWETRDLFERIYGEEEKHLFKFQEYENVQDKSQDVPEAPASEWLKIFTDDYFALLNKALASEIMAIIQYVNQHEKASYLPLRRKTTSLEVIEESNKAQVVSDLLKKVFMAEMDHFEKISERIYMLDGEATTNPDPLPQVGETSEDFIKLDRKAENDAIMLYRTIIQEATKRGDTTTKRLFEDIIMQEEEHYWQFDDYL
ncbi:MAG: ferritin-like domain-containing protein [Candidatus Bathyarchaeota archaeon]|nr:ferritin-like domain-containing protein [Candidatus Bathyarchaeota archaeon]